MVAERFQDLNCKFETVPMTHVLKKFLAVAFVSCLLVAQSVFAQGRPPLKVYVYLHTNDQTVGGAYINSYRTFEKIPGTQVVYRNIVGWNLNQFNSQLAKDFATPGASNMVVYGGHGVIGGLGTDGVAFNRKQALNAIGRNATNNGISVSTFVESCGSGIVCNLGSLPDGINAVYTASTANQPGWVFQSGGQPWLAEFGEEVKGVMGHFGDGTAQDPDKNKDGVVTTGELDQALNYSSKGRARVENPDEPLFFKNEAIAQEYNKFTECIILRPGQVAENYAGTSSTVDGITIEFKPARISGYGNRTRFPGEFPVLEKTQDVLKSDESQLNFDLRRLGSDVLENHIKSVLDIKNIAPGVVRKVVLLPTPQQANEFVKSLHEDPHAQGVYSHENGIKLTVGSRYLANHPSPDDKIIFDKECNPKQWTPPKQEPQDDPNDFEGYGDGENGGGGNGGGSEPTSGGFDALLSALMQNLLGGGKQNQQQDNQDPYGAGYGNPGTTCAQQAESPVCGADGKTYRNPCYLLSSGTVQVSEGICASPQGSFVMDQLSVSGIPSAILDTVRTLISPIISRLLAGATVAETVVR